MDMQNLVLYLAFLSFFFSSSTTSSTTTATRNQDCSRACGGTTVPYPFGFDPSCGGIQLNCAEGAVRIGEFHVRSIAADAIVIEVPPNCTRPVSAARDLFSGSFAMTSNNSFVLRNCSAPSSPCALPAEKLAPSHDNATACSAEEQNVTCAYYEDDAADDVLSWSKFTARNCSGLYSSMSIHRSAGNTTSFMTRTAELRWWLKGDCPQCDRNATCVQRNYSSGDRGQNLRGVNCMCNQGFVGDGFTNGTGCSLQETTSGGGSECSATRYIGSCREDRSATSKATLLVAGIICGAVLTTVVVAVGYFIRKHSTLRRSRKSPQRLLSDASCTVPLYPYREIERATNNFSERNMLGTGAYGTVYVGRLHNEEVAVKKLRHKDKDSIEQVLNEIKLLSSVSHPNLVRLLGCCLEGDEQILVYEFMPNGTLSQHLQRERGQGLPWTVRLNIASHTAKAIAHLHSATHPPIYHRDIKSSNILLDHNFNSKIADFGLSKMIVTESSHVSTAPQGTPGYLDPQYHQNFHLSDKSDVYSFGVVLVEIITAMKVVDFSRGLSDVNLAAMAINKIAKGSVEDIIDPFLDPNKDAWTLSSIHKVAELAFRCLAFHRDMRPSMMEVAEELERIRMSGWASADDGIPATTASSVCSSHSNCTDRSRVSGTLKTRRLVCVATMQNPGRGCSPISMDDPWRSEQSSPSADSLLGSTIR